MGLKVYTGVKILEVVKGEDGLSGVKIEKDGKEARPKGWREIHKLPKQASQAAPRFPTPSIPSLALFRDAL